MWSRDRRHRLRAHTSSRKGRPDRGVADCAKRHSRKVHKFVSIAASAANQQQNLPHWLNCRLAPLPLPADPAPERGIAATAFTQRSPHPGPRRNSQSRSDPPRFSQTAFDQGASGRRRRSRTTSQNRVKIRVRREKYGKFFRYRPGRRQRLRTKSITWRSNFRVTLRENNSTYTGIKNAASGIHGKSTNRPSPPAHQATLRGRS